MQDEVVTTDMKAHLEAMLAAGFKVSNSARHWPPPIDAEWYITDLTPRALTRGPLKVAVTWRRADCQHPYTTALSCRSCREGRGHQ